MYGYMLEKSFQIEIGNQKCESHDSGGRAEKDKRTVTVHLSFGRSGQTKEGDRGLASSSVCAPSVSV